MADVTLVPPIMLASQHGIQRVTGIAGEAIDPTAGEIAVYIKSNGLIWRSVAVALGAGAQFDGFVIAKVAAGDPVTIFQQGYKINVGAHGLTIGDFVWCSVTPGVVATATAGAKAEFPVAIARSAKTLEIVRMDLPNIDNT